MIKVFTTNTDGKIEFTKDELEKVLNEVWQDGLNSASFYWWTSPTLPPTVAPYYTDKTMQFTCSSGNDIKVSHD